MNLAVSFRLCCELLPEEDYFVSVISRKWSGRPLMFQSVKTRLLD